MASGAIITGQGRRLLVELSSHFIKLVERLSAQKCVGVEKRAVCHGSLTANQVSFVQCETTTRINAFLRINL
jgi:hypothetical protein